MVLSSEKHRVHHTANNTEISMACQTIFLFPIIDIMGNFLSYKSMLTRLESLLYKALRGIDLAELPIIVAVIAWLLALSVQSWARYRVQMADYVGQAAEMEWIIARY